MNVNLTNRINPPANPNQFKPEQRRDPVKDMGGKDEVDFATLMGNSNYAMKQKREAKKNGDFSGAKSDQELFDALNAATTKKDAPKNEMGKDDFMKLFIAQLQNQDPLKPKEDYEMAAHLAQFNGLEQMLNVNKKLEELAQLQKAGQSASMIDYIGKEVNLGSGKVRVDNGVPKGLSFNIAQSVPNSKLEVRDGSGQVVAEQDLGAKAAGAHSIVDRILDKEGNPLKSSVYSFSLSSTDDKGAVSKIPISTTVRVNGVSLKADDGKLYTTVGELDLADISSVGVEGYGDSVKAAEKSTTKTDLNNQLQSGQQGGESSAQRSPANGTSEGEKIEAPKAKAISEDLAAKPISEGSGLAPEKVVSVKDSSI